MWGLGALPFVDGSRRADAADSLGIAAQPDGSLLLQLQGAPAEDYAIQTTSDLVSQPWVSWTLASTNDAGYTQLTDGTLSASVLRRFYRAVALPPVQTTTAAAAGLENNAVVIALGGSDPSGYSTTFSAVITALPQGHGQLFQFDGTPITVVGTRVTDPQNRVKFVPDANTTGSAYATIAYTLSRNGSGVASAPQSVAISVAAPVAPQPTTPRVPVEEDTPRTFQLTARDPNPSPGGGASRFIVDYPPLQSRLYQVGADGVTQGAVILSTEVNVTNPSGLLMYVPKANANGAGFETLTYRAVNSYNLSSATTVLPFDIIAVNDPPTASGGDITVDNDVPAFQFSLSTSDMDVGDTVLIVFTQLPARGIISQTFGGPSVVVGQAYPTTGFVYTKPSDGSYLGGLEDGDPYAQFSWYAQDSAGATSPTVTKVIRIPYANVPPVPTGAPTMVCPPGSAAVEVHLSGFDPDGDGSLFSISTLPAHGSLYLLRQGGQVIPLNEPASLSLYPSVDQLFYKPDANYLPGQAWTDTFNYFITDSPDHGFIDSGSEQTTTVFINTTNAAPTLTGPASLSVTVDANGNAIAPLALTGFTVNDDSSAITNARWRVTLQAVQARLVTSDAGGILHLDPSIKYDLSQPRDGLLVVTASRSTLTNVLGHGNITYAPPATNRAAYLRVVVEDLGWTNSNTATAANLSSQVLYVPITYQQQAMGGGTSERDAPSPRGSEQARQITSP